MYNCARDTRRNILRELYKDKDYVTLPTYRISPRIFLTVCDTLSICVQYSLLFSTRFLHEEREKKYIRAGGDRCETLYIFYALCIHLFLYTSLHYRLINNLHRVSRKSPADKFAANLTQNFFFFFFFK